MPIIPIAEVNAGWQATWQHPSLTDAINTALSLDHMAAEVFMEALTSIPVFIIGRWSVRRHDRNNHGNEHNASCLAREVPE